MARRTESFVASPSASARTRLVTGSRRGTGITLAADFAHLRREDKERQLQEQIAAAVSLTDVPVVATTSWFRLANNRFYVPVSVAVPGSVLRVPTDPKLDQRNASVDLLGVVTDEQGRVGRADPRHGPDPRGADRGAGESTGAVPVRRHVAGRALSR